MDRFDIWFQIVRIGGDQSEECTPQFGGRPRPFECKRCRPAVHPAASAQTSSVSVCGSQSSTTPTGRRASLSTAGLQSCRFVASIGNGQPISRLDVDHRFDRIDQRHGSQSTSPRSPVDGHFGHRTLLAASLPPPPTRRPIGRKMANLSRNRSNRPTSTATLPKIFRPDRFSKRDGHRQRPSSAFRSPVAPADGVADSLPRRISVRFGHHQPAEATLLLDRSGERRRFSGCWQGTFTFL